MEIDREDFVGKINEAANLAGVIQTLIISLRDCGSYYAKKRSFDLENAAKKSSFVNRLCFGLTIMHDSLSHGMCDRLIAATDGIEELEDAIDALRDDSEITDSVPGAKTFSVINNAVKALKDSIRGSLRTLKDYLYEYKPLPDDED